jgi:hypothetical protein
VVFAAITAALGLGAAMAGSTPTTAGPALSCAKGSVHAMIGGKQTCLKVGQRCAKRFDRAYRRYRFQCTSGRLTRVRPPVPLSPVTVTLGPVDGSGVTGTAIVTPLDAGHTKVTLELVNEPPGDLPAHIHFDTCKNPSTIRFGLSNVVDGKSESTVSGGIAYLRRGHGAFSMNVHRAEPDLPIIACGDIPLG